MPRVLVIAYDFPPCKGVGGSLRSEKFVQYLKTYGWESTVLTTKVKNEVEADSKQLNVIRLKSLVPLTKPFHLAPYGWALKLLAGFRQLPKKSYDVIYVSCPPFPYLVSAVFLKKCYSLPLVVDFRDAWLLDPYAKSSCINRWIYQHIIPTVEYWVIKKCDGLILNTPSMFHTYSNYYKKYAKRMKLIPNGYDENDFKGMDVKGGSSESLRLLYSGRFGVAGRHPELLFSAIKKAIEEGMKIKLTIMGSQPTIVRECVENFGLKEQIQLVDEVSHSEAIQSMFKHDVLVVFQKLSNSKIQAVAGKTYEYLRTGKPILSIAPIGDNQNIVSQYAKRYEIVSDYKTESLCLGIENLYQDWKFGRIKAVYPVSTEYRHHFERKQLTQQMAEFLESLI